MKKYRCIADNFSRGRLWKQGMVMAIPDDDEANKHFKFIGEYVEPVETVIEPDPIIDLPVEENDPPIDDEEDDE